MTETTLPAFSNAYLVFTVLESEFRAVSVPGDLKIELAYMIYELLSLADVALLVVCQFMRQRVVRLGYLIE